MANLRTNNLSGEGGRNAYSGSLFFDGDSSYLALGSGVVPSFGTGDFTIEFWINQGVNSGNYTGLITLTASTAAKRFETAIHSSTIHVYTDTGTWRDTGYAPVSGVYEHIVFQRDSSGNTLKMYANGEEKWSVSNTRDYDEDFTTKIGLHGTGYDVFQGYLSNLRICIGHTVYSSNYFSPPTSPLTVHYTAEDDKTVLLCCQDFDNPIQEATGRTIIGYGDFQRADDVELITNGTFNSATTGWTAVGGATLSVSSGQLVITGDGGAGGGAAQSFTTVAGKKYILTYDVFNGTISAGQIRIGTSANGYDITFDNSVSEASNKDIVFTATGTTTYVTLGLNAGILTSGSFKYDNVSVTLVDGSEKSSGSTKVIPQYGTDDGNIFNGAISMNSLSYMYFPTGRTVERGGYSGRMVVGGGEVNASPGTTNVIEYFNFAHFSNGVDFGDLTQARRKVSSCSSSTRGIWSAGATPGATDVIDYATIATAGNATDFGNMSTTVSQCFGDSNNTRGIFAGGYNDVNRIEYITISTTGDATDFGDLTLGRFDHGVCASPTRLVIAGGKNTPANPAIDSIEFVEIATTGNATDFGDLIAGLRGPSGLSSNTRGLLAGGATNTNLIQYITIASQGNAADFGDLLVGHQETLAGGTSNNTRGVWAGGQNPAQSSMLQSVMIQSMGNAIDWSNLTTGTSGAGSVSDSHGGLS